MKTLLMLMLVLVFAPSAQAESLDRLRLPDLALAGTDGTTYALASTVSKASFTVFTFFSADCPCMRAHDAVLAALAREYAARGVRFFFVDSEAGATLASDRAQAAARSYPAPILLDPGAKLSRALETRFATATVIVDSHGAVRFRGGIDSSKRTPGRDTQPFLRSALESLLTGKSPNPAEPKSLGCFLRQS